MKKAIFIFILFFFNSTVNAQKPDTVQGVVNYIFLHQRDTLTQNYYKEDMYLSFSKSVSVYKSRSTEINDSILKAKIEQQIKDGLPVNLGVVSSYTKQNYYTFFTTKTVEIESPFLSNKYLYSDTIPLITWEVVDTFRNISTLHCQMAKGSFAGRLYEVWFCPDIAISAGPWKLSGLPGLIIEAYDSKRQVKFLFNGISRNVTSVNTIILPKDAIRTSRNDFKKMITAFNENPNGFNNSSINFKVEKKPGTVMKSNYNNPLELPNLNMN